MVQAPASMPIVIQPYDKEHEQAVEEFNRRLEAASEPDLVFPKSSVPRWLPWAEGSSVYNEYFVAVDNQAVRGAYALKHEKIFVRGKGIHSIACYHHPLSEGIIDRTYRTLGSVLVRDALVREPRLYALGMGGYERPLAKMLKALGWSLCLLPFYFRIVHPYRFLKEMRALRDSPWRAVLMNMAAVTGLGWLATRAAQSVAKLGAPSPRPFIADEVDEFSDWADCLWSQARDAFSMSAVRDASTLRLLYPANDKHFTRVRVSRNGDAIGWAVVGERRRDRKFGLMRVGSILDCWASPENAVPVVLAATRALERRGVDLIVSNQIHQLWCRALENSGFFKGPSNFIFAASKALTELLHPFEENKKSFHITRADGDGLPRNF